MSDTPLTDEEIDAIAASVGIKPSSNFGEVWTGNVQLRAFARAIRALPITEPASPARGEPVAWIQKHKGGNNLVWEPFRTDPSYSFVPLFDHSSEDARYKSLRICAMDVLKAHGLGDPMPESTWVAPMRRLKKLLIDAAKGATK